MSNDVRILVLQRGWVVVGRYTTDGDGDGYGYGYGDGYGDGYDAAQRVMEGGQ